MDKMASWAVRLRMERARRGWSRTDLAIKLEAAARRVGIDGLPRLDILRSYSHKWEAGTVLPDWKYQACLAGAYGLSARELFGDAAAVQIPPVLVAATGGTVELPYFAQAEDDLVQRRKLLAWLAALAAGGATLPESVSRVVTFVGDRPDRLPTITMNDVANLDAANTMFTQWEWTVGGAVSRHAVMAHVSWAIAQLDHRVPAASPDVLDAWRVATARLAQTAGWMCHDTRHDPQARALLVLGYKIASTVEHTPTGEPARAFLLTQLAHQAIDLHRPNTGLDIARHAQTIAETVSPTAARPR